MSEVKRHWPDVHVVVRQLSGRKFQFGVPRVFIDGIGLTTRGMITLTFDGDDDLQCVTLTIPVSRVTVEDAEP